MAAIKKPKKFIHSRSHSNHEKLFMKILVLKKEGFGPAKTNPGKLARF